MGRISWILIGWLALLPAANAAEPTTTNPTAPAATTTPSPASANALSGSRAVVVFYLDQRYNPVARVDRLKPMSEGMRAILAMYALQNGAGCGALEGDQLKCALTDSLGLGNQCSEEHIHLVSAWFKNGMPDMNGTGDGAFQKALKDGNLGSLCNHTPDTSGMQMTWEIIRVRQDADHVHVEAIRDSTANSDGPEYRVKYLTEYLINANDITILSHQQQPMKTKGDQG